jgi:hypothetical protein
MNNNIIRKGFIAAAVVNITAVIVFSKGFSNPFLTQQDPDVFSNFGLLMIAVWGLVYLASINIYQSAPWLIAAFAFEKLCYSANWLYWLLDAPYSISELIEQDLITGLFYLIYGPNDFLFMVFFVMVFLRVRKT